jgi:hypothetical protein
MGFLIYLLSPFSSGSDRFSAIIGTVVFLAVSGTGTMIFSHKGGGGSSGGMDIFGRRR